MENSIFIVRETMKAYKLALDISKIILGYKKATLDRLFIYQSDQTYFISEKASFKESEIA